MPTAKQCRCQSGRETRIGAKIGLKNEFIHILLQTNFGRIPEWEGQNDSPDTKNGCAAVAAVAKVSCDAQACGPTAKGLLVCGRFTVKATWTEIVAL
jgi:hypothetical protein